MQRAFSFAALPHRAKNQNRVSYQRQLAVSSAAADRAYQVAMAANGIMLATIQARTPPEILASIVGHLAENKDVENFRLTCKAFHDAAWPAFGRMHGKKIFHCVIRSGIALEELAHAENSAPYVRALQLSTLCADEATLDQMKHWTQEHQGLSENMRRQATYGAFISRWRQTPETWEQTARIAVALETAFQKFQGLEELRIVHGGEL